MFTANLRRVYRACDKIIVRTIRGRGNSFVPRGPNPGLDNRIQAFRKEGFQITDNDAEEYVEQSASDFYKVGEVYNEHLNETHKGKNEVKHWIVKDKYFKENMPNLLTWSEKEQIRHLNAEHPDEWTPEKLAESFPVTVPVLKKLIKFPWKAATEERIARHDASAMRNWRELKEGTLEIPQDMREHFLKFSNRTIPPLKQESIKIDLTQVEKMGEFESIVKRCAAQAQAKNPNTETEHEPQSTDKKAYVKKDKNRVTLDQLTTKIKDRIEKGKDVGMPDQILLNVVNTKVDDIAPTNQDVELSSENSKTNEVAEYKAENDKENRIMDYPERIRIPRNAYKKGATYKVNDCYYDHDGQFLYRVLGMSNN